jgi:hypothetical protein
VSGSSNMTFGHLRKDIYDRERCDKKLGDGEPGADAAALGRGGGGGFGLIDLVPQDIVFLFNPISKI